MERRLLENAATAGKRQKQSIHAQWLEKEAEVKQMFIRSDLIQQQHRAFAINSSSHWRRRNQRRRR